MYWWGIELGHWLIGQQKKKSLLIQRNISAFHGIRLLYIRLLLLDFVSFDAEGIINLLNTTCSRVAPSCSGDYQSSEARHLNLHDVPRFANAVKSMFLMTRCKSHQEGSEAVTRALSLSSHSPGHDYLWHLIPLKRLLCIASWPLSLTALVSVFIVTVSRITVAMLTVYVVHTLMITVSTTTTFVAIVLYC